MYRYEMDSGHGWLEVRLSELLELGISGQVSGFSYIKGLNAYLEEDCDMSLFMKAKGLKRDDIQRVNVDGDSVIRSYNHYPGRS